MAKSLAGRIVYRDGFEALEAMPLAAIAVNLLAKAGIFSTLGDVE